MIHGCTITASNYAAHARVSAESFLERHPGGRFSVLSVDEPGAAFSAEEPFEILRPADIGIEQSELNRRFTMYSTQGLAGSLKPVLLAALLARENGPVVMLDADSCVYADLGFLEEVLGRRPVVLSPHSPDPHPLWREDGPEQIFLRAGVINAGFIAAGPGGEGFLQWWSERTSRRCIYDQRHALLASQLWLTAALGPFDCEVLRDRGCNVAGWNLQSRDIDWVGAEPRIDDGPLRHFHFACSFDPRRPGELTPLPAQAAWWPPLSERPGVARLAEGYAARLLEAGFESATDREPENVRMPGGAKIEPWMRETFRLGLIDAEAAGTAEPPNPFADGDAPFISWLGSRVDAEQARRGEEWGEGRSLRDALLDRRELLDRITELEGIRDDAIGWAERSDGRVRELEGELHSGAMAPVEGRATASQRLRAARAAARELRHRARGR